MEIKLFEVNSKDKFNEVVLKCRQGGYHWASDFPKHEPTFEEMKAQIHGNAKLLLHCFYNSITHRLEMQCTTLNTMKTYPQFKGITSKDVTR